MTCKWAWKVLYEAVQGSFPMECGWQVLSGCWQGVYDRLACQQSTKRSRTHGVRGVPPQLPNPGRRFFLKLAVDSIRSLNNQSDRNGLNYARKAMIRCGLGKDIDGVWKISQLWLELQQIVSKHKKYFYGEPIHSYGEASSSVIRGSEEEDDDLLMED